jgi:hypothetical protein
MQKQVFYCTSPTGKVNNKSWIYIASDRWFEARQTAHSLFGTDQVNFKTVDGIPDPTVHQGNMFTLTWEGTPMDPRNPVVLKVTPWESQTPPIEMMPAEPRTGKRPKLPKAPKQSKVTNGGG